MKKSIIFVTAFLLVLLCSWGALASNSGSIGYPWQVFGNSVGVSHPHIWSSKGYFPLDTESIIPEGSTITYVSPRWELVTSYDYSGLQVRLVNESGDWTYLENGVRNYYFAGQTAKQKFYVQFKLAYMEWPGNRLFMRPSFSFGYRTP